MSAAPSSGGGGKNVPASRMTTQRLSVYLRCLGLLEAAGVRTVSSLELAERFHLNSPQIRKDLAYFGEFGTRGVGYDVSQLRASLTRILGLDREHRLVILGAGNLGTALAGYPGFNTGEFQVAALFDNDPDRIVELRRDGWPVHPVEDLERVVREERATIAVLAVPADAGQQCLDHVVAAGIRAVMSFIPVQLKAPEDVELNTVDLKIQLEGLAYWLTRGGASPDPSEGT